MAKVKVSDEEFERQYAAAVERGKSRSGEPRAEAVFYDEAADELVMEFSTGARFVVRRDTLPELKAASPAEVAEVELSPRGLSLHWETLDVDYSVAWMMANAVGGRSWLSAMGSIGGRASSEAKAAAARLNGMKGGRPPVGGMRLHHANTATGRSVTRGTARAANSSKTKRAGAKAGPKSGSKVKH